MGLQKLGTITIVTAVTALVWVLAAVETRNEETFESVQLQFVAAEGRWKIDPPRQKVAITVEGSAPLMRDAETLFRQPLLISLPPRAGSTTIEVLSVLRDHQAVDATRIALLRADPPTIDLVLDEIRSSSASIRPVLPGIQTEGDIGIDPPTATAWIAGQVLADLVQNGHWNPEDLVAEAFVEPSVLAGLGPGTHRLEVRLRPPPPISKDAIVFEPDLVELSFTLRSRIRELTIDNVRVQLAGPPQDFLEYDIELEPTVLRDIVIQADADLIRLIEIHEATVVAMVHLSNRDKVQAIKQKPVAYYQVLMTDWAKGQTVTRVSSPSEPQIINLTIAPR